MPLNPNPARPLTSREIAKLISGMLGTLAEFCEPSDICAAMAHFDEHSEMYKKAWKDIHEKIKTSK